MVDFVHKMCPRYVTPIEPAPLGRRFHRCYCLLQFGLLPSADSKGLGYVFLNSNEPRESNVETKQSSRELSVDTLR